MVDNSENRASKCLKMPLTALCDGMRVVAAYSEALVGLVSLTLLLPACTDACMVAVVAALNQCTCLTNLHFQVRILSILLKTSIAAALGCRSNPALVSVEAHFLRLFLSACTLCEPAASLL